MQLARCYGLATTPAVAISRACTFQAQGRHLLGYFSMHKVKRSFYAQTLVYGVQTAISNIKVTIAKVAWPQYRIDLVDHYHIPS